MKDLRWYLTPERAVYLVGAPAVIRYKTGVVRAGRIATVDYDQKDWAVAFEGHTGNRWLISDDCTFETHLGALEIPVRR